MQSWIHVLPQQKGLPTVTLTLNGDPINAETHDNFVCKIHKRFRTTEGEQATVRAEVAETLVTGKPGWITLAYRWLRPWLESSFSTALA